MPITPLESMNIRNIKPRQRAERQTTLFREDLERQRLRNRKEDFFHYDEFKEPIHAVSADAPLYCSEAHRFSSDFTSIQQEEKARKLAQQQANIEKKRRAQQEREQHHAKVNEHVFVKDEQKIKSLSERHSQQPKHPFNPITLEYDNSNQGQMLKKRDERALERSKQRAANLYQKSNSNYCPITGKELPNRFR
ncbi:hypothetical protein P9112_008142 [Eukaryota sp. TZLM1-RC]